LQARGLLVDVRHLRGGKRARLGKPTALGVTQRDQLFDLVERESEILRALDEANQSDRIDRVFAITGVGSLGFANDAAPLVITKRLLIDPSALGDIADLEVRGGDSWQLQSVVRGSCS
jgi:hypothetical protein